MNWFFKIVFFYFFFSGSSSAIEKRGLDEDEESEDERRKKPRTSDAAQPSESILDDINIEDIESRISVHVIETPEACTHEVAVYPGMYIQNGRILCDSVSSGCLTELSKKSMRLYVFLIH